MKALIFTLLLLSLPVLANSDHPFGLFQVDSSNSKITLFDQNQEMSGVIDIQKEFRDSKIKVESLDASFESVEILGDNNEFQMKGNLTYKGQSRHVTLKGRAFGAGAKIALILADDTLIMKVLAVKPTERTTALQKEVQEIIQ